MTTDHDERRVEYVNLKSLRADPRNPKAHAESAISASVARFGFIEPIIVDTRTGFIASGHGRTSTLTRMRVDGEAPPKGVRVNGKGEWFVPVVYWRSDNDYESGAALIALNRAGELGGWADETLLTLLHDLEESAEDLGFEPDDFANLERTVARIVGPPSPPRPEPRAKIRTTTRSASGDVWILGDHRLVVGEDDPAFIDAIVDRWEQLTGRKARRQ